MIYFLVNNDFHLYDVKLLASEIGYDKCALISVPYRMEVPHDLPFAMQYTFERCLVLERQAPSRLSKLIDIHRDNLRKRRQLDALRPTRNDTLFVFTECELMNMFCIDMFYSRGCRVYLIEDGIASYIYYNSPSTSIPKRWYVLKYLYMALYGLRGFNPYFAGNEMYAMLSDKYYTGSCFFTSISIVRNIKVEYLRKREIKMSGRDMECCIFLTQPVGPNSFEIDVQCISNLAEKFKLLYVKCHPREEDTETSAQLKEYCSHYNNVQFISTKEIVEEIIDKYDVGCAAALYSSTLIKLAYKGVVPLFLFSLFNELNFIKSNIVDFCNVLGYKELSEWDEVTSGKRVDMAKFNNGKSIINLLNQS